MYNEGFSEFERISLNMKKKGNFARYGGMLFFIIFVAGMFIINTGILYPKYETDIDTKNFPIVYSKNNTLLVAPLDKKTNCISDFLTVNETVMPIVEIADSGSAVYFFENYDDVTKSGSLFVTYDGKEKIPVSSKAYKNIYVSSDGKTVLYAENPNTETMSAKLFTFKKGEKKTVISEKADINNIYMDKKTGHVFYMDAMRDAHDLYMTNGKSTEKIDSDIKSVMGVPDGSSVIYKKNSNEVYYWQKSKQPNKISDTAANLIIGTVNPKSFIWYGESDNSSADMYVYDNQPIKLDEKVMSIYKSDAKRANVLYSKNFNPENFSYDIAMIYKGGEPEKIMSVASGTPNAAVSENFSKTAYIENSKLYIKEKGLFAEEEPILIADNVKSFKINKKGNAVAYVSGNMMYLRYKNNTVEVSSGVEDYHFTNDGNTLCYIANYNESKSSGNLYTKNVKKLNKDSLKIDSDVMRTYHARGGKHIVYIRNYNNETGEGELCVFRNGKITPVDSGKITILCEKY